MERKLAAHVQMIVEEFDTGEVRITRQRLDVVSRRVVPEVVLELVQSEHQPLTHDELLLIGAAERVAQSLGYQVPLPF